MKSKSFIAGALGVLFFFTGQSVPAQESGPPVPDQIAPALPEPDRESSILSKPDRKGSILDEPDRDSSILSEPDREGSILDEPDRKSSILPPPVPPPPEETLPARGAGGAGVQRPADAGGLPPAGGGPLPGSTGGLRPAGGQAQGAPSPAARGAAEERLPRTGMFWGATAGTRIPKYAIDDTDWGNMGGKDIEGQMTFNGGFFFGMDFGMFAGQAEIFFAGEKAGTRILDGYSYIDMDITALSLLVPLIVKLDYHLGPVVLQPLAGIYLNFALGDLKESMGGVELEDPYENPLMGVIFGGAAGMPLGKGLLFLDIRYAMDLGKTTAGNDPVTIWKRSAFMLNLGYQFFLGGKK